MTPKRKHLTAPTNKDRGQWFLQRSTYPLRDAPPVALENFWDNPNRFSHIYGLNWNEAGPCNFPGRVTSLIVDPSNPKKLYAGSAAGGVWVSEDSGSRWTSCWPRLLNQHIGALAVDPLDCQVIFCATGEGNLSVDSYCGSGIYQTADGGFTWSLELSGDRAGIPRRVSAMAFMLGATKQEYRIVLAAVSNSESMPAALYIDQGNGVQPCLFWGNRNYNCHSVVAHPAKPGLLYAAVEPRGTLNGIWRTEDFGKTWTHLTRGLPVSETCKRISLAVSPSDPTILYALVGGQDNSVLGVYRTNDGGESWRNLAGDQFASEKPKQASYNNCIAVHPKDPQFVLCGTINLHLTRDGGRTWTQVTTEQRGVAGEPFPANWVHPDHHALVITPDGILYSGNDGGVARSTDSGLTWQCVSEGMVTAMFYAADIAQSDSRIYGGGTQDNGTLISGVPVKKGAAPLPARQFARVLSGDGGWLAFDPNDAEHVVGSTADLIFNRHRKGEPWAAGDQLANWPRISIDPSLLVDGEDQLRTLAVLAIHSWTGQKDKKRGKTVFAGTDRLWQTVDDGRHWRPCSPHFDGSAISAITCSPWNAGVVFVGTSGGSIYRTKDGAKTWSHDIAGPAVPRRVITSIRLHPTWRKTLYVSVAATGSQGAVLQGRDFESTYGHVYRSNDNGDTWEDIDNGSLPDVVFNALAVETRPPYRLFAGGDAGVWVFEEQNGWASVAGSMPNAVVSDLRYHHKDRLLLAATYGRGIYTLKLDKPFPPPVAPMKDSADDDCQALGMQCDATRAAPVLSVPADGAVFSVYPRTTAFSWEPVEGAIGYAIVHSYGGESVDVFSSRTTQISRDILGANTVKWRVWAIFPDGWRSPGSAVRSFRYTV